MTLLFGSFVLIYCVVNMRDVNLASGVQVDEVLLLPYHSHQSRWNSQNLETEGVKIEVQPPRYLVDKEHPVISMLKHDLFFLTPGLDFDEVSLLDGRYYAVSEAAFVVSCAAVRRYLFNDEE